MRIRALLGSQSVASLPFIEYQFTLFNSEAKIVKSHSFHYLNAKDFQNLKVVMLATEVARSPEHYQNSMFGCAYFQS